MKISYNPKSSQNVIDAQSAANDDIIFDLKSSKLWAKGVRIGADWDDISNKPTSLKNPASIKFKDINGNVVTYDGSVAKDLTSGTYMANRLTTARKLWGNSFNGTEDIKGSIIFPKIGDTAISNGISWSGSSDGADIYYQTTAADQGNLVLNVKDGANAYIQLALNGAFKSHFDVANSYWTGTSSKADKWTTARTLTIGNSAKSVDGSGNVSWTLAEIGVKDTWRPVQVNGTSIGTNTLNLSNSTYIGVNDNEGKVTFNLIGSTTTANQAILSNGTVNGWKLETLNIANWNTAYNFVNSITGTDADNVINKWEEIVNFLAGIKDDNKLNTLLNSKLSIYTIADYTDVSTLKNNGIYYSTTDSSSNTLTNSPFNKEFALINMTSYDVGDDLRRSRLAFNTYGEIKVSNDRDYDNTAETWYNVLTSKNSGINNSTITLNGSSLTVPKLDHNHDAKYLKLDGSNTMQDNLNLCSYGSSYIGKGSGDKSGADFTEANIVIRSWYGISFKSFDDKVRTYIDTRSGDIGTKGKFIGNLTGNADSATRVTVSQHNSNDINYPLVWSNQCNTGSAIANQLFKSWQDLYYNPKYKKLTVVGSVSTAYVNASKTVTSTGFVHSSVTENANQYVLTADGGYTRLNQVINEGEYSFSKDITVTDQWTDIDGFYGGSDSFLVTNGTYVVQVYYKSEPANGMYDGYFSGIMSWYTGKTNSNNADEIVLHRAGHAYANTIYLRTVESQASSTSPYTRLQISANKTLSQNTYTFKFKRIC